MRLSYLLIIPGIIFLWSRNSQQGKKEKYYQNILQPFEELIQKWSNHWSRAKIRYFDKAGNKKILEKPLIAINPNWIKAIILVESSGNPNTYGDKKYGGSYGLMQILYPVAVKYYGFTGNPKELYDPNTNIYWGTKEFATQLRLYGNVRDAVYSYNTGDPYSPTNYKGHKYYAKWKKFYKQLAA